MVMLRAYRRRNRSKTVGFTIVEVIVSMAIFGVCLITITQLLAAVQIAQRNARYTDIAAQAVRAEVERRKVTNDASSNPSLTPPTGLPTGSTMSVVGDTDSNGTPRVRVKATYPSGSSTKSIEVVSLVNSGAF